MKWVTSRLDQLCTLITDGKHGDCRNEDDSGYYFISAKDVKDGKIHYDDARQITQADFAETHRRTDFSLGDVVITNSGTIGRVAIGDDEELTPRTTFQKSVAVLKPVRERVCPKFLRYSLECRREQLVNSAGGAAQKNLLLSELRRFTIPLPAIGQQEQISRVLSAYDELIENNERRMALLEETARQLYREWFVRLRFPGHEHTRTSSGVPVGWEKTSASRAMEILSGGTPKTTVADYWDGDIPFYTPKDATDTCYVLDTERRITELGLKNCNSRLYPADTVFISARGTVGKLNLAMRPMAMSQSCYALVGKGHGSQLFLFCALREAIEHFKQHAVGAVFNAIVVDTFRQIPFIVPDEKKVRLFENAVAPMFRQVANLIVQNRSLRAARDLLLPRLMSGEISV